MTNDNFSAYAMVCPRCNRYHALLTINADRKDVAEFVKSALDCNYTVVRATQDQIKLLFSECPLPKPIITEDNFYNYILS